jgi:hypothetical protein
MRAFSYNWKPTGESFQRWLEMFIFRNNKHVDNVVAYLRDMTT